MPTFSRNPLEKLAFATDAIDETFDLGDQSPKTALPQVEKILQNAKPGQTLSLRFEPAQGDGRETLFQPLGRYLLQARRDGKLDHCLPTPDGSGYIITLTGN